MTKTQHKRTAVASMFQNGISRNTKCAERDGFRREGHIYTGVVSIRELQLPILHKHNANITNTGIIEL